MIVLDILSDGATTRALSSSSGLPLALFTVSAFPGYFVCAVVDQVIAVFVGKAVPPLVEL